VPATFVVDQAATFRAVVLLSCEPKLAFGSTEQDKDKDGTPKWELQLVGGFRQFGRTLNEVIKVGVVSEKNPVEGIGPFSPVQLAGFEVGVMERTKNGEVVGVQVWYRAESVRPIGAIPNGRKHEHTPAPAA
jgi:hypothetical protein